MLAEPGSGREQDEVVKLARAISSDPRVGYRQLNSLTGISIGRIKKMAEQAGWKKGSELWSQPGKTGLWSAGDMN
jgi:hypothetical protein